MPYICEDCENKEAFERRAEGRSWAYWQEDIDKNGDVTDSYDYEHEDYEAEEYDNLTCGSCGSDNVTDVSDDEWERWKGPDIEPETWKERVEDG